MDCLITKLKGSVSDNSLLKLDEFRIAVSNNGASGGNAYITLFGATRVSTINGESILSTDGASYSNSITPTGDGRVYLNKESMEVNKKYELSVIGKYGVTTLRSVSPFVLSGDINFLNYVNGFTTYNLLSSGLKGKIKFKNINEFRVWGDNINYTNPDLFFDLESILRTATAIEDVGSINYLPVSSDFLDITNADISFIKLVSPGAGKPVRINTALEKLETLYMSGNSSIILSASAIKQMTLLKTFIINSEINDSRCDGDLIDALSDKSLTGSYPFLYRIVTTSEQTLNKFPSNIYGIACWVKDRKYMPLVWTTPSTQRDYILSISGGHIKLGTAQFIKDMSKLSLHSSATENYQRKIDVISDDLTSSAASEDGELQTAISTLQGKGVTVSIEYSDTAVNGIAVMSVKETPKYGIVYKGKELIVEPADTSKTLIAPANDCTYKEFNSLEEARTFISSNGLVKVESK